MTGADWIFMGVLLVVFAVFLAAVSELGIFLYRRSRQEISQEAYASEGENGDEVS